jgi:hypothetical protein
MRDSFQVRWPVAILVMVSVIRVSTAACAQGAKSPQSMKPPFTLSIVPAEPIVKAGSSVFVDATVANKSNHELSMSSTKDHAGHEYSIDVWDDKGATAPETKFGRVQSGHETAEDAKEPVEMNTFDVGHVTLNPGKALTDRVNVSLIYDLSRHGKYTIQSMRYDEESKSFVRSNKVTVIVTP